MGEAWNEHIQPVLDSYEWDHFSWVWDPFLDRYADFSAEQQRNVDNALVTCAFDNSDELLAVKALAIAEELHRAHIATTRLSERMRTELREQFQMIRIDRNISAYYVFAFSTFELVDAVPFIKSTIEALERARLENPLNVSRDPYRKLLRACCLSLLLFRDDDAAPLLTVLIDHESHTKTPSNSSYAGWTPTDIGNFWDYIGVSGMRRIVAVLQGWEKDKLSNALPILKEAGQHIRYRSSREKREVGTLIGELERGIDLS